MWTKEEYLLLLHDLAIGLIAAIVIGIGLGLIVSIITFFVPLQ